MPKRLDGCVGAQAWRVGWTVVLTVYPAQFDVGLAPSRFMDGKYTKCHNFCTLSGAIAMSLRK
jgi:hypothetical protein